MSFLASFFCRKGVEHPKEQLPRVPDAPKWEISDMNALRGFIFSETGRKLMLRARALEYSNAVAACNDAFNTAYSGGKAAGFGDALNWLQSCASDEMISRAAGEQAANPANRGQDDPVFAELRSF